MRRKDREIRDTYGVREIIGECDCCRLAFSDGKGAYIVPLSFGYDEEENALYFHGAAEGKSTREVLEAGVRAAWAGAEHTKDLVATKGRASYVGERGLGHQDPGATSYSYMLEVIAGLV